MYENYGNFSLIIFSFEVAYNAYFIEFIQDLELVSLPASVSTLFISLYPETTCLQYYTRPPFFLNSYLSEYMNFIFFSSWTNPFLNYTFRTEIKKQKKKKRKYYIKIACELKKCGNVI